MKSSSWKTRRWIAVVFASMLMAAPTAEARLDEGPAAAVAPPQPAVHHPQGFSWEDAGIGAGAALAGMVVAGGAAYVVRRRFLPAL
jgi:hypothetical protein